SLYFGGWSPRYLSSEMHASAVGAFTQDTLWPSSVIQDLQVRYFAEAEDQVGATTSNLYINGALHEFYRKKTFQNYSAIPSRITPTCTWPMATCVWRRSSQRHPLPAFATARSSMPPLLFRFKRDRGTFRLPSSAACRWRSRRREMRPSNQRAMTRTSDS